MNEREQLPVPSKGQGVAFTYNGHEVVFDDDRLINLTAMWKAAGSPENKEPRQWVRLPHSVSFINDLASSLNVGKSHVLKSRPGTKTGGTFAHWQVALAYAKYLSNEFHRFVNEAFREWAEEKADPDLKADRAIEGYRRQGQTDGWIARRLEGKVARLEFTATLKEHRVTPGKGYADCTDALNVKILGGTAREIKEKRGLPVSAKTRDALTEFELAKVKFGESLAKEKLREERAFGDAECMGVCVRAGNAVQAAIEAMK